MRAEIKRLHQVSGITSVYVTHDQIEAMTLGSRIAVMKDGILQQIGTPEEIYGRPANLYVAGFIGSPTMNFIQGTVEAGGASGRFVCNGDTLDLPCPAPQALTLGLRPEHIQLTSQASWRGEVMLVEPTGADTYVVVKTAAGNITVRAPAHTHVAVGEKVGLEIDRQHCSWFNTSTGVRVD
jgi:multiple sugar transport system ATP-binding protein